MSLNIKNERTHALVRELAALKGVSQTEAVEDAVRAQLTALSADRDRTARFERIMAISRETAKLVRESGKNFPSDDDLYDELGLPK